MKVLVGWGFEVVLGSEIVVVSVTGSGDVLVGPSGVVSIGVILRVG